MKDFLNNKIEIGQNVVYIKLMGTGSSSSRKMLFGGKVVRFTPKKVAIERKYTHEWEIKDKEIDLIQPHEIVVLGVSD
jgi:hypothetical protein